ncbi:hypothetical protein A6A20_03310 [Volucribacter amazonae]|uniref:Transmembrane protein n=2 Tax=Volucribacter amazonae TaxID=256731 RepID=A0A9X4SL39_9PAST|nr:hypothetical protein [Volucribacter amazonae]
MNKKLKVILNLSVITALLATGAQFYTNYKINQTLQQFPYYFSDKLTVHVAQTKQNFFSRELTFSIEPTDEKQKIEVIHTELTALPFAILAKSELPEPLIRKLNEKLNITIDENIINSRFSVVGDYLQSTMQTKFRDFTNVNQLLKTELNFASKTKFVEIQTALTGFNYDSVTEFGKLTGNYLLQPMGDHRYDLIQANVHLSNLNFINGENNQFNFKNIVYLLDKSFNEQQTYNLKLSLNIDDLNYNNQTSFQHIALQSNQVGIPNEVNFYEKIKALNLYDLSMDNLEQYKKLEEITHVIFDYLFNNKQADWSFAVKKITEQREDENPEINNLQYQLSINNQSKLSDIYSHLTLSQVNFPYKTRIKDLSFEHKTNKFDLAGHIAILKQYLFKNINTPHDPEFIHKLLELAKHYQAESYSTIKIGQLSEKDKFNLENIVLNYHDHIIEQDKIAFNIQANIDKLQIENEDLDISQIRLSVPATISPISELYPIYYCTNSLFSLTCINNLDKQAYNTLISQAIAEFDLNVEQAKLDLTLNRLSDNHHTEQITAVLNAKIPAIPNKMRADLLMFGDKLENSTTDIRLSIPASLIDEINQQSLSYDFWANLAHSIKPNNKLNPYFKLMDNRYVLEYHQANGKTLINNKPIEDYIQETE